MFRIRNHNRNYCSDKDFTRKLQIIITKKYYASLRLFLRIPVFWLLSRYDKHDVMKEAESY